jgi:hypothetical protein
VGSNPTSSAIFLSPLLILLKKSSILTEVVGEDKKTLTIFSTLAKNSVKFFHKTASQGFLRCFLPLTRTSPQLPRHAPKKRKNPQFAVVNACGRWYIIKSSNKGSCYGNKRY